MTPSPGHRIKQIAERSGFSAATLRYYEQVGILPAPRRTEAGYRLYDDAALDRLAFIRRVKQLGCSLAEIGDLTTAWEGGRCGPIQDRLRSAVAGKLADTNDQRRELAAFASQLEHAATALERHRPDGRCDDRCGCLAANEIDSQTETLTMNTDSDVAIACTLQPGDLHDRIGDWQRLLDYTAETEAIAGGRRLGFTPDVPLDELVELVAAEQSCCPVFRFAITIDTRGVALEVTAPADAAGLVEDLFVSRR